MPTTTNNSAKKKRERSETTDESQAECPFTIRYVTPGDRTKKTNKRRKQSEGLGEEEATKVQNSPFAPSGKFNHDNTLDLHYRVEPWDQWHSMTRYNSFVLHQAKHFSEGFIYVSNGSGASATQDSDSKAKPDVGPGNWVARILEIRAADEHHVYARVYWMYWPDELPVGAKCGGKYIKGRQPYHGASELIASNHMDVINVVSVTQEAKVKQWFEENDEDVHDALYWRQAFDVRSLELSTTQPTCKCNEPANPDKALIKCPAADKLCGKWLHAECVKQDALLKTFEALGRDKPHGKPAQRASEIADPENPAWITGRPLSPPDNGADIKQSIDAKAGDASEGKERGRTDGQEVKTETDDDAQGQAVSRALQDTSAEHTTTGTTPARKGRRGRPSGGGGGGVAGRKRKSGAGADAQASAPYEGLFEAELEMRETGSRVKIRDLRDNVKGGEKEWTEPIDCPLCGTTID